MTQKALILLVLMLGLGVSASAAKTAGDSSSVVPIDWSRFTKGLPQDDISQQWRQLLNISCKKALGEWWSKSQCNGNEGQYLDFGYLENNRKTGEFGKETKGGIREPSQNAYTVAVAVMTGAYDPVFTGVPRDTAIRRAVTIIKSLAKDHKVNGGIGVPWGDHWQSAQWSSKCAVAGWLLWDHLEPIDREYVRKMIEYEADRFNNMTPPSANANYTKDTKAEENGWDATGIQAACCLMPNHPRHEIWRKKAIEYRVTAVATAEDSKNDQIVDGKPVKDWVSGYNLDALGALGNHRSYPHPDYMSTSMRHPTEAAIYLTLSGQPVPQANRFHLNLIYACLVDHIWNGVGPVFKADGTVYWPIEHEAKRQYNLDVFALADAGAGILHYDDKASIKGPAWEPKHLQIAIKQEQTGYRSASGYLLHWLLYQGVRFSVHGDQPATSEPPLRPVSDRATRPAEGRMTPGDLR
jgi:hypothetical protein